MKVLLEATIAGWPLSSCKAELSASDRDRMASKSQLFTLWDLREKVCPLVVDNFPHAHTLPPWFSKQCSHFLTFQQSACVRSKQQWGRIGPVRRGQRGWLSRRRLVDTNRQEGKRSSTRRANIWPKRLGRSWWCDGKGDAMLASQLRKRRHKVWVVYTSPEGQSLQELHEQDPNPRSNLRAMGLPHFT